MVGDKPKDKIILIVGPTAVGKTAVAIEAAQRLNTEIISSDSMQIYRHMDIGTAKPSPEQQSLVKHHMIDIVDPWEHFSAGQYIEKVTGIIRSLHAQGKTPIVTGGTGLYMRAMTRGIFPSPSADYKLRKELLQLQEASPGYLYDKLSQLDPLAASKINVNDHRRLLRALEVCLNTDSTMSALQHEKTTPLPYEYIKIGLTLNRTTLYDRINKRVNAMLQEGLIEEARAVIDLIHRHRPCTSYKADRDKLKHLLSFTSMQAIGYKEFARFFYGEIGRDAAIALVKQRTRNYAKRQFTWFRAEGDIRWIGIEEGIGDKLLQEVIEVIDAQIDRF